MRTQSPGAVWDSAWYKSLKVFRSNTFKWKTIKTILALLYYESKYTSYMWQLFYYVQPYIAYRFSWPPKLQGWNQAILDRLEPELRTSGRHLCMMELAPVARIQLFLELVHNVICCINNVFETWHLLFCALAFENRLFRSVSFFKNHLCDCRLPFLLTTTCSFKTRVLELDWHERPHTRSLHISS